MPAGRYAPTAALPDVASIGALGRALKQAGIFEPASVRTVGKFLLHALAGSALYVVCLRASPVVSALLIVPTALVWIVAVMTGHDATHGAAFRSRAANAVLRNISFPFMSGMSGLFWRYKHNLLHHRHPNVVGQDEDLEMLPLAVGRAYHLGASPRQQWIQRWVQSGAILWAMTVLLPWDLRARSVRYLASSARLRGITREWTIDVLSIVAHWIVFLIVPAIVVGPVRAIAVDFGMWTIAGAYLGMVGLVGHTARPLVDRCDDAEALQFYTTRNIELGPILSWWFVGLDRQIEHHLFPSVSHFRLAAAAPLVRQYALAHGLPYVSQPLRDCLREITEYMKEAWKDQAMDLTDGMLQPAADRPVHPTWGSVSLRETRREQL